MDVAACGGRGDGFQGVLHLAEPAERALLRVPLEGVEYFRSLARRARSARFRSVMSTLSL